MEKIPSVGRVVLYTPHSAALTDNPRSWPAIVESTKLEIGKLALNEADLIVFMRGCATPYGAVPFSEYPRRGHWSWSRESTS